MKQLLSNGKSKLEIKANEKIQPIKAWNISEQNMILTKQFNNPVSYMLPIIDYAQNSNEIQIDIQNATHILFQYGFYNPQGKQTLVQNGKIATLKTISSKFIYAKLSGHFTSSLQGKSYIYTNFKNEYPFYPIFEWIKSRCKNDSTFSIVYQIYIKDIGWLKAISDQPENLSQQNKIISAFRMNLIPTTEKEYLIHFWNRDYGTTHIDSSTFYSRQ